MHSEKPLPHLKRYLKLYPGPDDAEGYPTFNILDPVSAQYYKIEWEQSVIFQSYRPGMTATELRDRINSASTFEVTTQDIEGFFKELTELGLLEIPKSSDQVSQDNANTTSIVNDLGADK